MLLGAGLFLSLRLRFVQLRRLGFSFRLLSRSSRIGGTQKNEIGDISPFQALTTSLATVVGNGNIAGVATAIAMGGPGAVFWMWLSAAFGMATKMIEAVLGQKFRERLPDGSLAGGPMYYLRNGMGLAGLAGAYALFMSCKATIATPLIQSNSIAVAMYSEFGLTPWITGIGLAVFTWLVIVGGIKTLGKVTEILSPLMVLLYVSGGIITVIIFASNLPHALEMIFVGAFKPSALGGGVIGVSIAKAMRYGMARGNYSNEAGIGTAAVFHAAAKTSEPARQGFLGSLDVFIDTMVICTLTALAILTSGAWTQGTSTAMTANAYNLAIPQIGGLIVATSSFLFGYSSLIGVTYYGKIALSHLLGPWIHKPYNWVYCVFVFVGATLKVEVAWSIGDLVNGLMVLTNLIGVLGLSGLAVGMIKSYNRSLNSSEMGISPQ